MPAINLSVWEETGLLNHPNESTPVLKQRIFWQNHFNEWIFLPGPKLLRFVSTNIFHFGAVGKTFCFSDYAIIVICNIHHRLQSENIRKVSGSILILKIQSCKMGSDITRRLRKHKIRLHKVIANIYLFFNKLSVSIWPKINIPKVGD